MGKKILLVLLCVLLTGCMQSSQTMQERLDEEIAAVSALPIPSASHRKTILYLLYRTIDWTLSFN